MKKILSFALCTVLFSSSLIAQENPAETKPKPKIDMSNRANDHFLLQLGYTSWAGIPDSINTDGISKSINAYFMFDFPFKTNPKLSMAFGPGIGSDHILFSKTDVGIKDLTPSIYFTNKADTNHFKKTKLATVYLEAPIEFRYSADPLTGKGIKAAIGVKVGTMINAHTRNTKFSNRANTVINDYTMKEASKKFFNTTRISGMARIGFGHFSLYGSYQFTTLFKDGSGPEVRPFSIGLTLSGL
ncbi:MAG: outer membrane beta-barrel protein [Chitinophagaceae bacterium]|nr:outer membrane beta-barrel protein [Chitinophagaceae bacterium]MBK8311893.1 outer membrane beta-barrel protein [Chitinophagaceae bacterium]MBK8608070.1 outer membrane beta-barrel protein [Chitinophagaceae bacterium]MBP7107974.1 outer membrane beta-barrel protein [Chitinophagaceae bacterium]MBP7314714.1 outer membrane beta-barrel protein [Chitinophagaceae bacterium]